MATATPATQQPQQTNGNALVETADRTLTAFIPFMEKDEIKLSVGIVQDMICVPTKSGKVCNRRDALRFIALCKARQLNPFAGDAYLIGYDSNDGPTFSLITAHQALLKRAEVHPEYDGMESGVVVRSGDTITDREGDFTFDGDVLLGAWATVFFKTRSHPTKRRVKLSTYNQGYSRWKKDPAGMIVKVAEADALRSSFPTMLGGMYLEEEAPDRPAPRLISPAPPTLPQGRQSLRAPAPAELPAEDLPPAEAPEPTVEQGREGLEREDANRVLAERIAAADTAAELDACGAETLRVQDFVGPFAAGKHREAIAARRAELGLESGE